MVNKSIKFFVAAAVCFILAIAAASWQIQTKSERDELKNNGIRRTAVAINRKEVEFVTTQGIIRTKPIAAPMKGTLKRFDSVVIYYDRDNPKRAVLDQDNSALDITLWIVVLKLSIVGLIFMHFGRKKRDHNLSDLN